MMNAEMILVVICCIVAMNEARYIPTRTNHMRSRAQVGNPAIGSLYSNILHRHRLQNRRHPSSAFHIARAQNFRTSQYPHSRSRQSFRRIDKIRNGDISKTADTIIDSNRIQRNQRRLNINLNVNDIKSGNKVFNRGNFGTGKSKDTARKITINAKNLNNLRISHGGNDAGIFINRRGGNTRIQISRNPSSRSTLQRLNNQRQSGFASQHKVKESKENRVPSILNSENKYKFKTFRPSAWYFSTHKPSSDIDSAVTSKPLAAVTPKHSEVGVTKISDAAEFKHSATVTPTRSATESPNQSAVIMKSSGVKISKASSSKITAADTSKLLKTIDLSVSQKPTDGPSSAVPNQNNGTVTSTSAPSTVTSISAISSTEEIDLPDLPDATEVPDTAVESGFYYFLD